MIQTSTLNIPSTVDDPCYRYKMPKLLLKTEYKRNGTRTKILNLSAIAKALRVPPAYISKFLSRELGTQIKDTEDSSVTVNGSFPEVMLRKHIDDFIGLYVLCKKCQYPEVDLIVDKETVTLACNACGSKSAVKQGDRLISYMIKNPPPKSYEFGNKTTKDDFKTNKQSSDSESEEEDERADIKEEPSKAEIVEVHDKIAFKDIEQKLIDTVAEIYAKYANINIFDKSSEEVQKILQEAQQVVPKEYVNRIPYIIFNAIFTLKIAKEISRNKAILEYVYEELKMENPEFDILMSLENFLLVRHANDHCEKYIPTILKLFYDEELLTEDFLISWDDKKLNSKLMTDFRYQNLVDEKFRALAIPILDWLREEEEKDEDYEDQKKSEVNIRLES